MKLRSPISPLSSLLDAQEGFAPEECECAMEALAEWRDMRGILAEAIDFVIDHACAVSCRHVEDVAALEALRGFVGASFAGHRASMPMSQVLQAMGVLVSTLAAPGERPTSTDHCLQRAGRRLCQLADVTRDLGPQQRTAATAESCPFSRDDTAPARPAVRRRPSSFSPAS